MSPKRKATGTNGAATSPEPYDVERARPAAIVNSSGDAIISKTLDGNACVTGVGAEVARTRGRLGLDMRGLRTHRTLAQALAAPLDNQRRRS